MTKKKSKQTVCTERKLSSNFFDLSFLLLESALDVSNIAFQTGNLPRRFAKFRLQLGVGRFQSIFHSFRVLNLADIFGCLTAQLTF